MTHKEALSKSMSSQHLNNYKRKRRLLFAASGLAVIGLCIALKLTVGNKPANAQLPNPFRKSQPAEQATRNNRAKDGVQQTSAELPHASGRSTT